VSDNASHRDGASLGKICSRMYWISRLSIDSIKCLIGHILTGTIAWNKVLYLSSTGERQIQGFINDNNLSSLPWLVGSIRRHCLVGGLSAQRFLVPNTWPMIG